MKQNQPETNDTEPHVFDQTNGVIDLPSPKRMDGKSGKHDSRSIAGIAMLSTQRP